MQDDATVHPDKYFINVFNEVFKVWLIYRRLWPENSPGLNSCDFILWGNLRNEVYSSNPQIVKELKENIYISRSTNSNKCQIISSK
jgi:hypothetical protein